MNIQFSPVRFEGSEPVKQEINSNKETVSVETVKQVIVSESSDTAKPSEKSDVFVKTEKSVENKTEKQEENKAENKAGEKETSPQAIKPSETQKKQEKYVDPLLSWPWRALGYTNDLGVAISEVAPKLSLACWVPAFLYFGADIYDKYKNNGTEYNPDGQRGVKQAIFQAIASIAFPFVVGHFGSSIFSTADKFRSEKLSSNAKEQALDDIKDFIGRNDIYGENKENTGKAVESDEVIMEKFKKEFETSYSKKQAEYEEKGFFGKALDYIFGGSKAGAKPNADKEKLTNYAIENFKKLKAGCNSTKVLKDQIEKKAFKLKLWKSAGSFAALIASVSFIDKFTENVIIHKCVEPGLDSINHNHKHDK